MKAIARAMEFLKRLDAVVFFGGGKDIKKPKPGMFSWLNQLDYHVLMFLDWIDSKVLFKNRRVRTSSGRVRSRGERSIIKFFEAHGVEYAYEPPLTLDGITLHPDFYLPKYRTYVEFWGMADISLRYRKIMQKKKALYEKHSVCLISLYPRNIGSLEKTFPGIFLKATGKNFPLKMKGG